MELNDAIVKNKVAYKIRKSAVMALALAIGLSLGIVLISCSIVEIVSKG